MAYYRIATVTVGTAVSSISFTSIPNTYTDLFIITNERSANVGTVLNTMTTNNTTNYHNTYAGNRLGARVGSVENGASPGRYAYQGNSGQAFGNSTIYIPNYAGSTNKSYSVESVFETNATSAIIELQGVVWSNTAAINAIQIYPNSGNYVQYTTAYLYGVKNA